VKANRKETRPVSSQSGACSNSNEWQSASTRLPYVAFATVIELKSIPIGVVWNGIELISNRIEFVSNRIEFVSNRIEFVSNRIEFVYSLTSVRPQPRFFTPISRSRSSPGGA
jgi:pyridoxine/pyridoxamine 5'-phosphate oxidase